MFDQIAKSVLNKAPFVRVVNRTPPAGVTIGMVNATYTHNARFKTMAEWFNLDMRGASYIKGCQFDTYAQDVSLVPAEYNTLDYVEVFPHLTDKLLMDVEFRRRAVFQADGKLYDSLAPFIEERVIKAIAEYSPAAQLLYWSRPVVVADTIRFLHNQKVFFAVHVSKQSGASIPSRPENARAGPS